MLHLGRERGPVWSTCRGGNEALRAPGTCLYQQMHTVSDGARTAAVRVNFSDQSAPAVTLMDVGQNLPHGVCTSHTSNPPPCFLCHLLFLATSRFWKRVSRVQLPWKSILCSLAMLMGPQGRILFLSRSREAAQRQPNLGVGDWGNTDGQRTEEFSFKCADEKRIAGFFRLFS